MTVETFSLVAASAMVISGAFTLFYLARYDRRVASGEAIRYPWTQSGRKFLLKSAVLFVGGGIVLIVAQFL